MDVYEKFCEDFKAFCERLGPGKHDKNLGAEWCLNYIEKDFNQELMTAYCQSNFNPFAMYALCKAGGSKSKLAEKLKTTEEELFK